MIVENAYFKVIKLDQGNEREFIRKCWYGLNINKAYPNEEVSADAFLDWARDLFWIKQNHIIIVVEGNLQKETRDTINFLNQYWEKREKQVDFIIVDE